MKNSTKILRDPPLYLDYQATTPCDERVLNAMLPYLKEHFGNPHSRNHYYGWKAQEAVEQARKNIASVIQADPREIIFTSGATEANNLAIKGVASFLARQKNNSKNHLITSSIEHKCILEAMRSLEPLGFRVTHLPVDSQGIVQLEVLKEVLSSDTALVSIMAVSNELGTIQPIKDIAHLCREKGIYFHTDGAQAMGRIPLNMKDTPIDLMSLSGHKVYGPKGVGVLYVRRKPRVRLDCILSGGGQERGMRSGTLAPFLCVGMGQAALLAEEERVFEHQRLQNIKELFLNTLFEALPSIYLNGHREQRIPGSVNISFAGVEGESLMMGVKDLALSSGSACTSASLEPSYVLKALGVPEDLAHTSLRISFGRFTTEEDALYAAGRIVEEVRRLRALSPLWDMIEKGIDLSSIQWASH